MAFSFMPDSFVAQEYHISTGSIQQIEQENVVLVANNFIGGEVVSSEEENSSNYFTLYPLVISFANNDNFFIKNKTQLNGYFIHNLSTNKQKVQQIRAP